MNRWFAICKSLNVIEHVNKSKDKNHMIISINAEKVFDRIEHTFMVRIPMKLGIERMYFSITRLSSTSLEPTSY
jgi:hypothetical protein